MLAHAKDPGRGGSRVAIIMNGSPLFTGDAGSGESEIRRWILENDLLEALIALPEQLFYNTGIATYFWVLTNRKRSERRGKVQLIDATSFWVLLRKSLGAKRREVPFERKQDILRLLADFEDGATRRVDRDGEERDVVVSRRLPHDALRLPQDHGRTAAPARFPGHSRADRAESRPSARSPTWPCRASGARPRPGMKRRGGSSRTPSAALLEEPAGQAVPGSGGFRGAAHPGDPRRGAQARRGPSGRPSSPPCPSVAPRRKSAGTRTATPNPIPSCATRRTCPSGQSVESFFEREVKPHVPDAWIDTTRRDPQDGEVGMVGYEINFNRYFYEYRPPRPLEEIEADIQQVEKEIVAMLREMTE